MRKIIGRLERDRESKKLKNDWLTKRTMIRNKKKEWGEM